MATSNHTRISTILTDVIDDDGKGPFAGVVAQGSRPICKSAEGGLEIRWQPTPSRMAGKEAGTCRDPLERFAGDRRRPLVRDLEEPAAAIGPTVGEDHPFVCKSAWNS